MKINIEKLEDIAKVIAGQSPISSYYNEKGEGYPFLQGKTDFGKTYPKARTWCTKPKKLAEKNDILLSVRAPVGAVNISNTDVCIGRGICAIRANKKSDYNYLYYYLKTHERQIQRYQTGSTFKSITVAKIKQLKIPLPEKLDDQKKIANLLIQVETLITKREESIELLDELLRSSFLDMFGDPVLNPKKLSKIKISQFASVQTGSTPSRKKMSKYYENGQYNWVKTTEVKNRKIYKTEEKISLDAMNETNCKLFPKTTVLIAMYGQGKTRGRVGILMEESATNQACAGIIPNKEYNSMFLFYQLQYLYNHIRSLGRGGGQPNLNLNLVKNYEVISPINEDNPNIKKFATIVKQVESTKEQYQNSLNELHDLFGSLSQRAFRGELNLEDKKKVSALDFKVELGKSVENNLSFASKIKDLGVKFPKLGIDTSSLGIGSKLAEGIVNIDASSRIIGDFSLVGKEYNALHETLSSFGRAKMTDIFPSMSESLASSFMTNEQFSKSLLGNALELDKYTKALTSNYFKTWKQEEEDRLSNLIARPTLGLSSSELWKNKISDAIGSSALSNLESVYGVNSAIETMNMWKHENERLQALQVPDYFKVEQEKFEQLAGLGKYDEHIRNFTKEHESLFNPPSSSAFDTSAIYGAESIKELNSKMETLSLEALDKSFEVDQPYKLALEQMEAMNPLRDWGERHEARINRYSEKLEETTKVIESIPNLSELMDDEFFDNISWKDSYDNIKELVYRLIDEGKLEQVFDEDEEKIILVKVER